MDSEEKEKHYSNLILIWVGDLNHLCGNFSTHKTGIIVTYLFDKVFLVSKKHHEGAEFHD